MHKKAKEMMEKCLNEICSKEQPSPQMFLDFKNFMCGASAMITAEKDFSIIEAMKKAEEEEKIEKEIEKGMSKSERKPERYGARMIPPYYDDHEGIYPPGIDWMRKPMGYNNNSSNNNSGNRRGSTRGMNYDSYQDAKRNYTETHSQDDKRKMDDQAKKAVSEAWDTIREAYRDGDQNFRSLMKQEASTFVSNEMK